MRILYIGQPESGTFSGPSVHINEVIRELGVLGHEIKYIPCCKATGSIFSQAWRRLCFALGLRGLLREFRPDWVYQREQLADPFVPQLCRLLGIRCAVETNGLLVAELRRDRARGWTVLCAKLLQAWSLSVAEAVICPAANWIKIFSADYGLSQRRFHFIQNGVQLKDFSVQTVESARLKLNLPTDELVLGFLGSVYRNYDFDPILQAVSQLHHEFPRFKLRIIGPGPQRPKVLAKISELGLHSVVELGDPVPHEQSPTVIASFDICLMPYCQQVMDENCGIFSMKLQEYTASGRPLLAHDFPGSDSYPYLAKFGWAFRPGDPDGAVQALRQALSSADERQRRGREARLYAESLSWTAVAQKIDRVLTGAG